MTIENAIQMVYRRANERSAELIEKNASKALIFPRKPRLHGHLATLLLEAGGDGLLIECGVFKGRSINRMAKLIPNRQFYGFDSFEGLSEKWAGNFHESGHFNLDGILPAVEPNVELIKGWVDDTFEPFLKDHKGPIDYLHVDTDTYSPAKTILSLAKKRLAVGSIILFDELYGYPGWENHEYKALKETLPDNCYEYIGFSQMEAAIRITKKPS